MFGWAAPGRRAGRPLAPGLRAHHTVWRAARRASHAQYPLYALWRKPPRWQRSVCAAPGNIWGGAAGCNAGCAGRPPPAAAVRFDLQAVESFIPTGHNFRIHRCNCECGDYTFGITYDGPLRRAGRSGAGLGLALALRSRLW